MADAREHLIRLLEASAGKEPDTPAEKLRHLLTELEIRIANMAGTGEEVLAIPSLMDRIADLMAELETTGIDLKPERTRWESAQALLRRKAAIFVREARQGGGLKAARAKHSPPRERWWWYLDEWVAQERRRRLRKIVLIGAGVVLVIAFALWFIQSRLPRDPRLRRIIDLEPRVDEALISEDWDTARALLEELRTLNPDNPEYPLLLGAVYERLNQPDKAQSQYEDARRLLKSEGAFYTQRASAYLQVGLFEKALADARRAVELAPESEEAYFYLGNAYEALGKRPEALAAYQRASELAEAHNNSTLLVVIRVRMAALLQRP